MKKLKILLAFLLLPLWGVSENFDKGEQKIMLAREKKTIDFFEKLSIDTIDLVDEFYDPNATFLDPLGEHQGAESIKKYYRTLYKNVISIHFVLDKQTIAKDTHILPWTMYLKANGLNGGEEIVVTGISKIIFSKKNQVIYHRDYFDMGEFVYERIPVLKSIIAFIKKKLKSD